VNDAAARSTTSLHPRAARKPQQCFVNNSKLRMVARGVLLLMTLNGAVLVGPSGMVSAQVILGIDGSMYSNGRDPLFVSSQPCRSYQVDIAQTEKLYPGVARMVTSLPLPADVTVSLQLAPDPPPYGERASYYVTSISRRVTGPRDARELCTSRTPGGYYEGVLTAFTERNGIGKVELRLSGDRHVILLFTSDAPPLRLGRQIVGKTSVRVYVDNIVGPDGDESHQVSRIEALP
jgi:hypothetical protein